MNGQNNLSKSNRKCRISDLSNFWKMSSKVVIHTNKLKTLFCWSNTQLISWDKIWILIDFFQPQSQILNLHNNYRMFTTFIHYNWFHRHCVNFHKIGLKTCCSQQKKNRLTKFIQKREKKHLKRKHNFFFGVSNIFIQLHSREIGCDCYLLLRCATLIIVFILICIHDFDVSFGVRRI